MKLKDCKITHERAKELQKEYTSTRGKLLKQHLNLNSDDVSDVTFDLKILEKYIAYVKKEANKQGLTDLGLRVYLGSYPKNDATPNIKNPGYSTIFFMPTRQTNNNSNRSKDKVIQGVDGLNFGTGGHPPNDL